MRWGLLLLLVMLPLQWFVLGQTPLGIGRLHQFAMVALLVLVASRYRAIAASGVVTVAKPFVVLNMAFFLIWAAADVYHGQMPAGPVQQALYLAVALSVGTCVHLAASEREPRAMQVLRWAGPLTCVSLCVGLAISMFVNGVSPGQVLAQTISTGDPEIFQRELFRTSFGGFGYDAETVQGNIRHEVFAAVLLAMYVSSWAVRLRPLAGHIRRLLHAGGMALGCLLLILSLSRSVLLAAAAWPVLALWESVVTGSFGRRQLMRVATVSMGAILAVVTGFGAVLWNRFYAETESYNARERLLDAALEGIGRNWLLGGVNPEGASSHNLVLDAWLRSGIFAAAVTVAIVFVLLGYALRLFVRTGRDPGWMVPVAASIALPLVRLFTSGAGLIPPVEWVTLGFMFGALAFHRDLQLNRLAQPFDPQSTHSQ